jgi:hypothetical protein
MALRVVLWSSGHVAAHAGCAVLEHPDLELVGCHVRDLKKSGRDVGELIGTSPTGVVATSSIDEIVAMKPDAVAYYELVKDNEIDRHVLAFTRLLRAGINVVTTSNFVTGRWWGAREELEAAAAAGGASLFGSGVNPGFINAFALTATSVCRHVERVHIQEEAECSGYDSPDLWESVAFGLHPDEAVGLERVRLGTSVFEDTVAMMADALEVTLDEVRYVPEFAVATRDLDLGFMTIRSGHIAGLKNRWIGISAGAEIIELTTIWKMTDDVTPNWEIRHGWHIEVIGDPVVRAHVAGYPKDGAVDSFVLMDLAMSMTAMPTIHAIPHVVAARPGIVTYKDLPLIGAARRVVVP